VAKGGVAKWRRNRWAGIIESWRVEKLWLCEMAAQLEK